VRLHVTHGTLRARTCKNQQLPKPTSRVKIR
jgi:hypothetical protein